ncbi:MAG TPA: response regulator [Acidobacteriaceae bacterium]|nr:response regulator [Acidobacteriaceae bacterium]
MTRPCFLVVDREFSANISTRKLVIETAKFNVITAYSGAEAIETLKRFPAIDAVVLDTVIQDMQPEEVIAAIKAINPGLPVILICAVANRCPAADYHLELFSPASLLELLQRLHPQATGSIQRRDESLSREGR